MAIIDSRAIADGWRTDGLKIFRPYTCGSLLRWARTTIHGVVMFDGWVTGHHWRTHGRKVFRPYIRGVGANWAGATICGAFMFDG